MTDLERTGLLRLMLRMPALRGPLQDLYARDGSVRGLCGAYEDARATLEQFKADPAPNASYVAEYESVCLEIEADMIERCTARRGDG